MGTSEKSAKAFARHYFAQLNYATATGDTAALQALASRNCESCANFGKKIERIYSVGGQIRSDGWEVILAKPVGNQPDTKPILQLAMLLHTQKVSLREGSEMDTFKGGKQPMTMYLERSADRWRVDRLDIVV